LGKPVVATRVGGTPEVINDGVDGFLTRPRDPSDLADRLLLLLTDETLRARMGEAGEHKATEQFSMERRVKEMESIYREMTAVPALTSVEA
jgi:glycosyltransferase involved in cell wall biosynthesis